MISANGKRVRTCIGCGEKSDKTQLFRIVKSPDRVVSYDASGRLPGRGAYVCSRDCFEIAVEKHKLGRALRHEVGIDEAKAIALELEEAQASAAAR